MEQLIIELIKQGYYQYLFWHYLSFWFFPIGMIAGYHYVVFTSSGGIFDPDLDQIGATNAEYRVRHELGLLGVYWFGWWSSYAAQMDLLMGKGSHRSWLTHSIIPGTVIRLIWFDFPVTFPYLYLIEKLPAVFTMYTGVIPQVLLGQFLAFAIGDVIHLYLDNMLNNVIPIHFHRSMHNE